MKKSTIIRRLKDMGACDEAVGYARRQFRRGRSPAQVWWAMARQEPGWCLWLLERLDFRQRRPCPTCDPERFCLYGYNGTEDAEVARDYPWSEVSRKWEGA